MKYNNDFKYDLIVGHIGEKYLNKILTKKKIEVKTDLQAGATGNIFIEYFSRGKKSGISTTESDWYCFVISNEKMILIETKELKEICRSYVNSNRDIKGGDSNTSKGILLPIKDLFNA
tara:strand:+ start:663 stop:1016 length:354 start_codon:yes stop_codon:yes gene_type:complete